MAHYTLLYPHFNTIACTFDKILLQYFLSKNSSMGFCIILALQYFCCLPFCPYSILTLQYSHFLQIVAQYSLCSLAALVTCLRPINRRMQGIPSLQIEYCCSATLPNTNMSTNTNRNTNTNTDKQEDAGDSLPSN